MFIICLVGMARVLCAVAQLTSSSALGSRQTWHKQALANIRQAEHGGHLLMMRMSQVFLNCSAVL